MYFYFLYFSGAGWVRVSVAELIEWECGYEPPSEEEEMMQEVEQMESKSWPKKQNQRLQTGSVST